MGSTRTFWPVRLGIVGTIAGLGLIAAGCESSSSVTTSPDPAKCQLTLTTPAAIVAQGGAASVTVTAQPECEWTVSSLSNWISEVSPTSGQGNGSFTFRVAANPGPSRRESEIAVNDSRVRVSQAAASCAFDLAPTSHSIPASGSTGTINVTALTGCTWVATASDSWITITSDLGGNGTGTVSYRVDPNSNAGGRAGSISVGGRTFSITQDGQSGAAPPSSPTCSYSLSAGSQNVPAAGGPGTPVTVTAPTGCAWTAGSTASWITVTSGAMGAGSGTVAFTVAVNTGANRSGTIAITGHTFTVTQSGAAASVCSYAIDPAIGSAAAAGANGSVTVRADATCPWTSLSNQPGWLTVTAGAAGMGNGTVGYSVAANTGGARSGTITIAGQTFTVNQGGAAPACTFAIDPTSANAPAAGASGHIAVTAGSGCAWTVSNHAPQWITITSGAGGQGNGTIAYSVAANSGPARSGSVSVADKTFTITQAAPATPTCTYSLSPTSISVGVTGGTRTVIVTAPAGCAWTTGSNESWINVASGASGSGNGSIGLSIPINVLLAPRSGTVSFSGQGAGNQTIAVNQGIL